MEDMKIYKTEDLVLKVNKSYNPLFLDFRKWDRFLDLLCGDRNYQKEAIENAIIFLATKRYNSLEDLISENWNSSKNIELKNRYRDLNEYLNKVQLPGKLNATIDLATGTGKSYVIYGIAQIMLGLGLVDKVLVLCPSLTIERELKKKFLDLSSDSSLLQTIPEEVIIKNPSITDASKTVKIGDICVENIHAAYESNNSSIQDSFKGVGNRVLVLNDEAHHIYNQIVGRDQKSQNIKKWKEFLSNEDYSFKYILGFTGTAYVEDEYFNDVIYRFSLRKAVDTRVVKMIDYVSKDDSIERNEKFKKIYDNHIQNQIQYRKVKPLTILITSDITKAIQLKSELVDYLINYCGLMLDEANEKVLLVTSHKDHKSNVESLSNVDSNDDPIEWIISVSMLTEGWDVKNVFQIVPWEDRAFNSKLLIAQVLGRGLRLPPEYLSPQPKVRIFNHDAWSRNIRGLVNEILEIEMKLFSSVIEYGERIQYHFSLQNVKYEKIPQEKESTRDHKAFDYSKGYIELIAQVDKLEKETEYYDLRGNIELKSTFIEQETFTIDEIVNKIYQEFKIREWEGKMLKLPEGTYTKDSLPPKAEIKKIIKKSMERVGIQGERLVKKNKYKIDTMFSTLLRKKGKTVHNIRKALKPDIIDTSAMMRESLAVGNLRRSSTVFYSEDYDSELEDGLKAILQEVIEDESFPRSSSKEINPYLFKTPFNFVFTKSEPERKFVELLCKRENAEEISAWVKSRDQGFYSVEYSITLTGGKHSKQLTFNPDFIIKIIQLGIEVLIVVEIKADNDVSIENKAKLKYAKQHFSNLCNELEKQDVNQKYIFHFLSPSSYGEFFEYLRKGKLANNEFRSELEDKLEQNE